jgi:hypothetical protein
MTTAILKMRADWITAAAGFGLIWNAYGVYQFAGSLTQTEQELMAMGMSAEQAALYLGLPAWISVVFGIGVFTGLAGSLLLAMRRALSRIVLATSLAAYLTLFIGDVVYGVFASMPSQLAILAFVVAVAAVLLAVSHRAFRKGLLN